MSLKQFASDHENVHTVPVQTQLNNQVNQYQQNLPVSLFDILLKADRFKGWSNNKAEIIQEFTADYGFLMINTYVAHVSYQLAVDNTWHKIMKSPFKETLIQRFFEELIDGFRKCPNGKLARLTNVFQGFENTNTNTNTVPVRQAFQHKFASLVHIEDQEEQLRLAIEILQEYQIPVHEHQDWLHAL
jgi:hypothetical protein